MEAYYELESYEVRDLPGVLKPFLGSRTIKDVEYKKLPQAGFGSVMIKTLITLSDGETVNAVSKVLPPNEDTRIMFQIEKTYANELHFYKTVVPILNEFRRENGGLGPLRAVAKFLGGRMTLREDSEKKIDDDAVLVLEDLGVSGHANREKGNFFDLESSEFILRDLAEFQGTAIALKLQKPKVFDEDIKSKYQQYYFQGEQGPQHLGPVIRNVLAKDDECRPYVENKTTVWESSKLPVTREPYGTITHNDLWVNNTMQQTLDGKVVGNKIVDFQLLSYGSAATDVFFFIWTSVDEDLIKSKFDYLFQYYHDRLVETIKNLGCDTSIFSYEKFLDEIRHIYEYEFGHASAFALMCREMFAKGKLPEGKSEDGKPKGGMPPPEEIEKKLSQEIKEFYWFMFKECIKRGWIKKP